MSYAHCSERRIGTAIKTLPSRLVLISNTNCTQTVPINREGGGLAICIDERHAKAALDMAANKDGCERCGWFGPLEQKVSGITDRDSLTLFLPHTVTNSLKPQDFRR